MPQIQELKNLYNRLDAILDAEYTAEARPSILIDVLASIGFMNRFYVQNTDAKRKGDTILHTVASSSRLFEQHKSNLLDRVEKAITKPQIFNEHQCNSQILEILGQIRTVAPQVELESSITPAPLLPAKDAIDKRRTGSLSSDGSTTLEGTPSLQPEKNQQTGRPASPFKLNNNNG